MSFDGNSMDAARDVVKTEKSENGSAACDNGYQLPSSGTDSDPSDDDSDIDARMQRTIRDIEEVETFLRQLNERKTELVARYDKLKEEKIMKKSLELSNKNWHEESFPWSKEFQRILKETFRLKKLRTEQLKTMNAIMSKHDVLLLAPTGAGKSLCYQLPAVFAKGITVVVSPLLALMENQIWALQKLGIEAEMLSQSTDRTKNNAILKILSESADVCSLKLLYVTPERMAKSKRFRTALQKGYFAKKLNLIAIDEVHCCSQWGHDFRPDYKFLGTLKTMFPEVPILGVTATATSKVIIDVQKMLNIRDCLVLKAPFNRPNLFYHVMEKPSEKAEVLKLLTNLLKVRYNGQSGIIYTFSIRDAEDIASELVKRGIQARPYHATLNADNRTKVQTNWLNGYLQVVVATIAFGMGIDKPDVRFVIHHTISKSMENFYQESGRAGRDGKRAECILMYRFADMSKVTTMMFSERTGLKNAYLMTKYCIDGTRCRRNLISEHFAEVWNDEDCNKMCDRCFHRNRVHPAEIDIRNYCLDLYKIIDNVNIIDNKVTGAKLIDAWYQKGASNLRCDDVKVPNIDRYYAEQIVAFLITEQYLREDFHFTAYATISYIRRGVKDASKVASIAFQRARILNLPGIGNSIVIPNGVTSTSTSNSAPPSNSRKSSLDGSDDVVFVSEETSAKKRRHTSSKDRRSKSVSGSSSKDSKEHRKSHSGGSSSTSSRSTDARPKRKSTQKSLNYSDRNDSDTSTSTTRRTSGRTFMEKRLSRLSQVVTEAVENETKRRKRIESPEDVVVSADGENDDVLLVQKNGVIIEID